MLVYRNRQYYLDTKPHLYASVKLNKDLGRRCNVYADFHDLAGQPKAPFLTTEDAHHNRALTLGMTYKFLIP